MNKVTKFIVMCVACWICLMPGIILLNKAGITYKNWEMYAILVSFALSSSTYYLFNSLTTK